MGPGKLPLNKDPDRCRSEKQGNQRLGRYHQFSTRTGQGQLDRERQQGNQEDPERGLKARKNKDSDQPCAGGGI
ncbi:hypothetical protein ES703_113355 [subsurface metagenome]